MNNIIPAILSEDFSDIQTKISLMAPHVKMIQLDVCDGVFVPTMTWPFQRIGDMTALSDIADLSDVLAGNMSNIECDGMHRITVDDIDIYATIPFGRQVFHIDSSDDIQSIMSYVADIPRFHSRDIGIAVPSLLEASHSDTLDMLMTTGGIQYVQVMGIAHRGMQGQAFDESCVETIRVIRARFPEIVIQVDGGMNADTIPRCREAGADRFVVGSAIWNSDDPVQALQVLSTLVI